LNFAGFQGGLLQMLNLGVAGAGLFFVAGFLHTRLGPPELRSMGGLAYSLPLLSATFLVIALATVGLPGTGGFNGEHLVLIGAYEVGWLMALAAGVGTVLTAAYLLWYFQRAFLGPAPGPGQETAAATSAPAPSSSDPGSSSRRRLQDLRPRELLIAVALGGVIFWIGLDSGPLLREMNGSLRWLEQRIDAVPALVSAHHGSVASLRGGS